jgi:hypothetical protein
VENRLKEIERGTEGRNRTGTPVKEPDFESGASTSSATPAREVGKYSRGVVYCEQIFAVGQGGS